MQQSKLLEILRHFSGRQLTRFRDFLDSPYFNRSEETSGFFIFLEKYAPGFEHADLKKSKVLKKFKTQKTLTEKRLAYLMNQLQKLAEEFVAIEHFRSDDLAENMTLLDAWDAGELPRHYKRAIAKAAQIIDKNQLRNADYYLNLLRLSAIRCESIDRMKHQFYEPLQQASDALDDFYLVEKLRYGWAMASHEYILNLQYDWQLGTWVMDYIADDQRPLNPTAQIYLAGIKMVKEPDNTGHYFHLKELLEKHATRFNEAEQKDLFTSLVNYCTRRINRENDARFSEEYLDINKKLLANGLLFEAGKLPPLRFINLVNTGLRCGQTEWVDDFIKQYHKRLPEDHIEDVTLIARGQYHYHLREYGQAQRLLNQVNPPNVLLAITIRNLLTRVYYETGETELLLSFLEAYRVYLLRQDLLSPQMKKQARHFVDFTRKLAKIDKPEADQLPKLKNDLPPASGIYHREWLLEQIEQKMRTLGLGLN